MYNCSIYTSFIRLFLALGSRMLAQAQWQRTIASSWHSPYSGELLSFVTASGSRLQTDFAGTATSCQRLCSTASEGWALSREIVTRIRGLELRRIVRPPKGDDPSWQSYLQTAATHVGGLYQMLGHTVIEVRFLGQ